MGFKDSLGPNPDFTYLTYTFLSSLSSSPKTGETIAPSQLGTRIARVSSA